MTLPPTQLEALLKPLKAGKSVRESLQVANLQQSALSALGSIEITDKEYWNSTCF